MSALLIAAALAYYGVTFDPAATNVPSSSRIIPVNATRYRMIQPDGVVRNLSCDPDEPGVLLGERPWIGVVEKNVISVWADPEVTEGRRRTAFTFVNGQLRGLYLDGAEYEFPSGRVTLDGTAETLWPERKRRTYERNSEADIWRLNPRLRLWYANPNSAGMLFAQVALLGLWLLLAGRGIWRFHGMTLMAMSLLVVAESGSRCALVGFVLGAVAMAVFALRGRMNRRTILALLGSAGLLVAAVAASGIANRFTDTLGKMDPGNVRRVTTGKAALEMFADAPFGWHCGEVPGRNAALNWYVKDDNHVIRTHLLTMAELGWFGGFGYAAFWLLMLGVGGMAARRGESLMLGEWTAFAVAGVFNPVYTEWSLWVLPVASALWGGWRLRREVTWRQALTCLGAGLVLAALMVLALAIAGRALNGGRATEVFAEGRAAVINGREPAVWIVEDAKVLGGWGFPGREVLWYYARHRDTPALGYATEVGDLPSKVAKLVLPGRAAREYLSAYRDDPESVCRAECIMFLSPAASPAEVPESLRRESRIVWLAGSWLAMRDEAYLRKHDYVRIMPGVEQYVPNWMRVIFRNW